MKGMLSALAALALFASRLPAQTADSIIARYIRGIGGLEAIQAANTARMTGRVTSGGGFEAATVQETKRPNRVRSEFTIQGMTAITAYDGRDGWKIMPFGGKKDPEPLSEEEMRAVVEEADFDGPLMNYQQKGHRVELLGTDQVEGTDVYKLKVTFANGDSWTYFLDTENCIPIKVERRMMIRGAEQTFETTLGNYQKVSGLLLPFSIESRQPGSPQGARITFDKIEINVPIDDSRFARPAAAAPAQQPPQQNPDGGN